MGSTVHCGEGLQLVLERANPGAAWLPVQIGTSYTARVRQTTTAAEVSLSADTALLSAGPGMAAHLPRITPGATIRFTTATVPDLAGSETAIGGGPALVRDRKALPFHGAQPRHPRSAMGWNNDYYFLVEVDGRQRFSAGMTFPELAAYMVKLGCTDALNLDGGGSATLWVYGTVINSPSEGRERPAANALVVVQEKKPRIASKP